MRHHPRSSKGGKRPHNARKTSAPSRSFGSSKALRGLVRVMLAPLALAAWINDWAYRSWRR